MITFLIITALFAGTSDDIFFLRAQVRELSEEVQQFSAKISNIEETIEAVQSDLEKKADPKVSDLEARVTHQNQQIHQLQKGLQALIEAIEGKSEKIYVVQDGDSLSKIAIKHHTTTKRIKELNNLSGDSIRVGQKLTLPE